MKHLRFLPVLLCCLVAGMLTSCLNDDDNNNSGLTKAEQYQAFMSVAGSYSGKAIYYNRSYTGTSVSTAKDIDSTDVSFSLLTDSTARIYNFPLAAIAQQIKNDDLANALLNASPAYTQLDLLTQYYNVSPAACVVAAKPISLSLDYGGSTHQVEFGFTYGFYYGSPVSYGAYIQSTGNFMIRVLLGQVKVDGSDVSSEMLFNDNVHGSIVCNGHR